MRVRREKTGPQEGAAPAINSAAEEAGKITPRMHFYAVHDVGQQLRRGLGDKARKKPDRMVGR